jgi:hypothetical protein
MKGDINIISYAGPIVSLAVTIKTQGDKSRHDLLEWATNVRRPIDTPSGFGNVFGTLISVMLMLLLACCL